jgi:CBS domain-containing protein
MGEQNVRHNTDEATRQAFMRSLLEEVQALELMLEKGMIESGKRRIGAEQEMFLINKGYKPALTALDILDIIDDERFTHEIGLFNLEANLAVREMSGGALRAMEKEAQEIYRKARETAAQCQSEIALVGILPTLSRENLGLDAMVPTVRYKALNDALRGLRGEDFQFTINGIDQLIVKHDNVMLEACNTSFQVHFQTGPEEFARIAVFEYSIDERSEVHQARGLKPRVHFGDHWIEESVVEIFKEDIARFRVLLTTETEEDVLGMVARGEAPALNALRLHNGTVYRWNRACYGVHKGIPHLRIENRVIPSGPTVIDEIANAAFFFGMMAGMAESYRDVRDSFNFDEVKANFLAAARDGIRAQMNWVNDQHLPAKDLILQQLLPMAREGLQATGIDADDIERYLGVLEDRVTMRRTGARWALESLHNMQDKGTLDQRLRCLVSSMVGQQTSGRPISEWTLAQFCEELDWRESYQYVSQFMVTDLFTVRPDDIVDFAASLMDWRHIRHVPVEDDKGRLVGLVSHRALLRLVAKGKIGSGQKVSVSEIMNRNPVTVAPNTRTVDAIRLMRESQLACLPVVEDDKLVGLVTEHDLIVVSSHLLERYLAES